jgi:hypothetical protein
MSDSPDLTTEDCRIVVATMRGLLSKARADLRRDGRDPSKNDEGTGVTLGEVWGLGMALVREIPSRCPGGKFRREDLMVLAHFYARQQLSRKAGEN